MVRPTTPLAPHAREEPIVEVDHIATRTGRAILKAPGLLFAFVLFFVRRTERRPPSEVIGGLKQ